MSNNIDKIGYFKGKAISSMTRDELLEFARYAGKELSDFIEYKAEHHDLDLQKDILSKRSTQNVFDEQKATLDKSDDIVMLGIDKAILAAYTNTPIITGYVGKFLGYVRAKGPLFKKRR